MDTPTVLTQNEALGLVRQYKQVIMPRFNGQAKVLMFGSYSKGNPNPWSDIDVAVIVPAVAEDKWLESLLIEPVLIERGEDSMLYKEVMRTGITA